MSAPRRIVPGTTYLLTRRCFGRLFLLRPCNNTNQIFKFCLAVAAARTGVRIHSFCVLSNHYHLVATDVDGNLPVFMHWLNEYVAKCVNAELGRWESFWAPGSYSAVALVDRDDVIDKLVYVFTNPVEARLVCRHEEWPGASSSIQDMAGATEVVHRPEGFFREDGPVPASETLQLLPPPAFDSDYLALVASGVAEREREIRNRVREKGLRFLGADGVLAQSPFSCPSTTEPRRGLNPRVASRSKWHRIEALQRLKSFLWDYRLALKRYVGGDRTVVFPFGTFGMRVRFGVPCADP